MPVTDKQLKYQKLMRHVKDKTLDKMGRIRASRRLLKISEHSARAQKASRALARELLKAEEEAVRKAAADLLEYLMTQRETDVDENELDEIPETTLGAATYTDPFDGLTVDAILEEMNQNALADPPAKFIYFPTGQAVQYLRSKYTDLFANFTDGDIADMQSPYDRFLGFAFGRVINPEFYRAYKYWCWLKFAHDGLPGHSSPHFLRFCREEDVRRWTELGTLVGVPSEQPCGAELRRREHISGAVKTHEIPFCYCLYLDLLAGNKEPSVNFEDTPFLYLNEFCGVKTTEERNAELQGAVN